MLRIAVLIFSIAILVVALCLRIGGNAAAMPFAIWGGVLLIACLVERWRYQVPKDRHGGDWAPTEERYVDPESGRPMRVFYNARTGDRRYDVDGGKVRPPSDPV